MTSAEEAEMRRRSSEDGGARKPRGAGGLGASKAARSLPGTWEEKPLPASGCGPRDPPRASDLRIHVASSPKVVVKAAEGSEGSEQ